MQPPTLAKRKVKLVFVGDAGVGKTSMMASYIFDRFEPQYVTTIGIDFFSKTMIADNVITRLHIWDTAGQERYRSLVPGYIRDAQVAVVVYDTTDWRSFLNAKQWIADVRRLSRGDIKVILVGNKIDLKAKDSDDTAAVVDAMHLDASGTSGMGGIDSESAAIRSVGSGASGSSGTHREGAGEMKLKLPQGDVSRENGMKLASELKVLFFETSAKTGENLSALFETFVQDLDEISVDVPTSEKADLAKANEPKTKQETFSWCCVPWSLFF